MAEKKSKFKVKIPKLNASRKSYDFSLSLPGMISAVGAGVLALTFFFVMGILIGRGYRPESDVPQLGQMMPSKEHGALVIDPIPEVLTAEELDYPERLKATPAKVMDDPTTEATEGAKKIEKPKPEKKTDTAAKDDKGPEKPEVFTPTPAKPGEKVFNYIYQAASFKKADMAEALSAKLAASGLRTNIESGEAKGATWYRVQILHHGTPSSTAEMKAVLAQHGIKRPLLRKKTPAQ